MRFHERTLNIKWKKGVKRPEKSNAIDMLCSGQVPPRSPFEVEDYERNFEEVPTPFTPEEREEWLSKLQGVVVSSDAFVSHEHHKLGLANYRCSSPSLTMSTVLDGLESSISLLRQEVRTTALSLTPATSLV